MTENTPQDRTTDAVRITAPLADAATDVLQRRSLHDASGALNVDRDAVELIAAQTVANCLQQVEPGFPDDLGDTTEEQDHSVKVFGVAFATGFLAGVASARHADEQAFER